MIWFCRAFFLTIFHLIAAIQHATDISKSQKLGQPAEKAFGAASVDPLVVNFEEGMRLVN